MDEIQNSLSWPQIPDPEFQLHAAHGEGEEGIDRISGLPDGVLGDIIPLMPTKDGARTQILAKRWRNMWPLSPLNLDHNGLPVNEEVQAGLISHIVANHKGSARRLSLPVIHLHHRRTTLNMWLQSLTLKNLQILEFEATGLIRTSMPRPLISAHVFNFSHTLRIATFSECQIPDMTKVCQFGQLSQLGLESVMISNYALHHLIVCCPALGSLLLKRCYGFDSMRINSNSLKNIAIDTKARKVIIIIEDTPMLERFLQLGHFVLSRIHLTVISAPKLEILGCIYDYDSIDQFIFGTTVIQRLDVVSFTAVVCSIKVLAISTGNISPDIFINLMRCFPCMEKLYIKISNVQKGNNICLHKNNDLIKCLDTNLKTIVLKNYRGTKLEANFASFFVLNAKMLKLMRFEGIAYKGNYYKATRND